MTGEDGEYTISVDFDGNVIVISNDGIYGFASFVKHIRNAALDEAAQLADDIDSGKYTATKTAAQAIRALREG